MANHHGLIGGYADFFSTSTNPGSDMLSLQASMEMLERSSADHHHHQNPNSSTSSNLWRGLIKPHHELPESANLVIDESSFRSLYNSEDHHHHHHQNTDQTTLSLSNPNSFHIQQQHILMNDHQGRFVQQQFQQPHGLTNSKYLVAAQELLNEFVSLGRDNNSRAAKTKSSRRSSNEYEDQGGGAVSSSSFYSLDLLEFQRRKARLLSMLEEVDKRYMRYRDHIRLVVSSFEAVAGEGAAAVYSTLASKAMSRHFRCLRDNIMGQIMVARKAMGEKDPVAPGTTCGETPRLRLLDQCFRQHKAFQQGGLMENHPWRPQRGLPERSVSILRAWLFEHFLHPYPTDVDKHILARQTGLSRSQVSNWFINARVRLWKPMVEQMYTEELKEGEINGGKSSIAGNEDDDVSTIPDPNPNPRFHGSSSSRLKSEEHKPSIPHGRFHDSESLSSVVNTREITKISTKSTAEIDFSAYGGSSHQVSLTLGLQQHNNSLFFSRDQMEDCQQMEDLPYRNLVGAQLLHDLAG